MPRILLLAVVILASTLAATPAVAQAPPDPSALPNGARIQITLRSPVPSSKTSEMMGGIATLHRADADSIAFQQEGSDLVRVVPWGQVQQLYLSEGRRRVTAGERLSVAGILTLIGAAAGYSLWHSCNEPESDAIWSCIVTPRRLGSSVRGGTWAGFTLGAINALASRSVEEWRPLIPTDGPRLLIGQAHSGLRVGVNFRF